MNLTTLANGIGKGVIAGVAGTAAMTVSSTLEAKLRGRPFSTAPAKAATKALGIETIYQDSALVTQLSIARNLFLGREPIKAPKFLNRISAFLPQVPAIPLTFALPCSHYPADAKHEPGRPLFRTHAQDQRQAGAENPLRTTAWMRLLAWPRRRPPVRRWRRRWLAAIPCISRSERR